MKKITIDNFYELNKRLIEKYGFDICHSSGIGGFDMDIESAKKMAETLTEILIQEEKEG